MGSKVILQVDKFVIAHSDDFRWFGSENVTYEWDALIKNFNKHKLRNVHVHIVWYKATPISF